MSSGAVRTTTAPPLFAFHHVNAYEDDASDVIVMDVCTLNPELLGKPVHAIIKSIYDILLIKLMLVKRKTVRSL